MEYDGLENTEFAGFAVGPILTRSASGVSYSATKDEATFVLKVLPPSLGESDHPAASRFLEALETASTLSDSNLVRFIGLEEAEGFRFAVLEHIAGPTLAEMIDGRGALPLQEAADILRQVFKGLAAAHKAGLVHGSLESAKLVLDPAGKWKITGFGFPLRDLLESGTAAPEAEGEGGAGVCPEGVEGSEIDVRSDLYAAGVIAYEMLTGAPPFTARSEKELRPLHATEAPRPPADVNTWLPPFVSDFVLKLLAKEPAGRFAKATTASRALEAALAGMAFTEEEEPEPEPDSEPEAPAGDTTPDEPEGGGLLATLWEAGDDAVPEAEKPTEDEPEEDESAKEEPEGEEPEKEEPAPEGLKKKKAPKRPTQVVRGVFASLDGSSTLDGEAKPPKPGFQEGETEIDPSMTKAGPGSLRTTEEGWDFDLGGENESMDTFDVSTSTVAEEDETRVAESEAEEGEGEEEGEGLETTRDGFDEEPVPTPEEEAAKAEAEKGRVVKSSSEHFGKDAALEETEDRGEEWVHVGPWTKTDEGGDAEAGEGEGTVETAADDPFAEFYQMREGVAEEVESRISDPRSAAETVEELLEKVRWAWDRRSVDLAAATLMKALDLEPENPEGLSLKSEIDGCLAEIEELREQGEAAFASSALGGAKEAYEEILRRFPGNRDAVRRLDEIETVLKKRKDR
ncbi:MAG: serine/threonine-protein kinase, partial [Planctomycetota bacterium]